VDAYNIETAVLMIGTNDLSGNLEVEFVAEQTMAIINLIKVCAFIFIFDLI
jgi:hypothetical protein